MPDTYTVTIDLHDPATLSFLQGKSLRVYKSTKSGSTGLPVVWFSQNDFAGSVTFAWSEQYAGFVRDGGNPTPGLNISDISAQEMDLGQVLTASNDGEVAITDDGVQGTITVSNSGDRDWMCGMGQMVQGQLSPICAFDLGGEGENVIMEPYEKVLLVFESTAQVDTGTVIAEAESPSLTIELDGSNRNRTVIFRKDSGWTKNQEGWATKNPRNLNLAKALIVPQ